MHGEKYENMKKEIRSLLLTYKDGVALNEFLRTFQSLIGQRLPFRDLGFSSPVAFLQSMPDVVDLHTDSHGKVVLQGIADEASQHIQKLVSKQKTTKSGSNRRNQFDTRQQNHKLPSTSFKSGEIKTFLPGPLRAEFLNLINSYDDGINLTAFAISYTQKYKKLLNLYDGMKTLEDMIKLIPELELKKNDNNEIEIYKKKDLNNTEKKKSSGKSYSGTKSDEVQEISSPTIHKSGIPDDILKDFELVLQKYPNGIQNVDFPTVYQKVTDKRLDIIELGYQSLADLVEALPTIFQRVSNPNNEQNWLIYPSWSYVKQNFEAKITTDNHPEPNTHHYEEDITADMSSPTLQFIQSTIPGYINLNDPIPVFVSAILSPSLFWFQLQTDEIIEKWESLENEMQYFYSNFGYIYKMKNVDIAIGATCVIQCPDDNNYYRATIESIPNTKEINVSFIDYGSRDNVPRQNLYYVWSKFHEHPSFAFKACLAGLQLPEKVETWSSETRKAFVDMCNHRGILMAYITPVDKDNYSVYLYDNNGDETIYLHEILINEGYAESLDQNQVDIKTSDSTDFEELSNNHRMSEDSDSGFANNQDLSQSSYSDASSESNELPVNRKIPSPTIVHESFVNNCKEPQFSQECVKRYVKEIEICESRKIHLINLENKLYMSLGGLSGLLFREKSAEFLNQRLIDFEIDIPVREVNVEDYPELFKQCLWFKIRDFEEKDSNKSHLVLCPLQEAAHILNFFGHPSIYLRVIIEQERKTFNPHDKFWDEFYYGGSPDIIEEINKLCLYDLKTKREVLKAQICRVKLLGVNTDPDSTEIRRIQNTLNIVNRRMEEIEDICSKYNPTSSYEHET